MNLSELFASGDRRCHCIDMKLVLSKIELTNPKLRHSDPMKNLMANVILGPLHGKPRVRWIAKCDKCGKIYLVDDSQRKIKKLVKESGIEFEKSIMIDA